MSTIFTKIAKGEIPSYKVAENEDFYAFLDINPVGKAHTLVIPRKETDYIFDIENTDDLKCCIEGGMTAKEIGDMYLGSHSQHLRYFYFGCNHPTPQPIANWETLRQQLVSWLPELITDVLSYPFAYESYKLLYVRYVTDIIKGCYGRY